MLSLSTPLLADARVRLGLSESHLDVAIRSVVSFDRMAGTDMTVLLEAADDRADLQPMIEAYR